MPDDTKRGSGGDVLLEALNYSASGFSVIPIRSGDKKPLIEWAEYQKRLPTEAEVRQWWAQWPDANIGVVTGAISGIVVIDIEREGSTAGLPPTVTSRTGGGGWHLFYKHPGVPVKNSVKSIAAYTDVRGDGGYVVLPPSLHSSGKKYEWSISPRDASFEPLPVWILEKVKSENGWTQKDWEQIAAEPVYEGERNNAATQYAGKLLHDLSRELWETSGWAGLREWNRQNCRPPLDERELRSVFESIAARETGTRSDTSKSAAPVPISFTSLGDLLNEPEENINWIVEDLLPSNGFSVMAAKPKVGKSTLARQLALSVAQGQPFLDRQTVQGGVLYVALEEKRSEVKNHFRLLGGTGNEDLHSYIGSAPQEASKWLDKEIKARKPILVIIDTLFRFVSIKNGNDYAEVTTALSPLLALARENGAHLMVVHHAGKGAAEGGDAILGSTAIFGSVDTAIILRRTESRRTIETQQRYGTDIEPTVLVFDEAVRAITLGGTKEEVEINLAKVAILAFLDASTEPVGEAIIREDVGGRAGPKSKALRQLVASGGVARIGKGVSGSPFLYSRSLVPSIDREPEKPEPKSAENIDSTRPDSSSQDSSPNSASQTGANEFADDINALWGKLSPEEPRTPRS